MAELPAAAPVGISKLVGELRLMVTLADSLDDRVEWLNALCAAVRAEAVADELQRIDRVLSLTYAGDDGSEYEHIDDCEGEPTCPACWAVDIRSALAGGSVPVAAPRPTMDERLTAYLQARGIELAAGCLIDQAAYVDEEARELVEAAEANDWQAARLEVADVAHALVGTARKLGTTVETCMEEKLAADQGRGNARSKARSVPVAPPAAPAGACRHGRVGGCGLDGINEAASPVPAEQAAEPPAASWGDLAADVMGLVDRTLDGEAPVPAGQPAPWFRETRESLAMLDDVRAEVEAVEAAAEQPEGR